MMYHVNRKHHIASRCSAREDWQLMCPDFATCGPCNRFVLDLSSISKHNSVGQFVYSVVAQENCFNRAQNSRSNIGGARVFLNVIEIS